MWEESPIGLWTLEVLNDGRSIVELKEWSIAFLGTETPPQPIIQEKIDVPVKVTPAPPPPLPPCKDLDSAISKRSTPVLKISFGTLGQGTVLKIPSKLNGPSVQVNVLLRFNIAV